MNAGFSRAKYWLSGVLVAAAASLAHANPMLSPRDVPRHNAATSYRAYSATLVAAPRIPAFDNASEVRAHRLPAVQYAGVQYAGAITPVSTETRGAARPPSNSQAMHAGSIRDDVARYNEERVSRQIAHPPGEGSRPPGPSPYRN
ncbi:hypothetical protein QYH69_23240 [Paraburkholderia sp. SARCC-3016]|uniref:hypothetical protein n=1 Tax=Paraburkholderia sp. SARCC-3016 TaxID=3058611 RepID=UPI002807046A|nr:hypothetical protein [Paraburkholderia sp. SARCC-3016]MDQ7980163.1 hypothetical protein [Paraburkholderia sp. SARCC-3016]